VGRTPASLVLIRVKRMRTPPAAQGLLFPEPGERMSARRVERRGREHRRSPCRIPPSRIRPGVHSRRCLTPRDPIPHLQAARLRSLSTHGAAVDPLLSIGAVPADPPLPVRPSPAGRERACRRRRPPPPHSLVPPCSLDGSWAVSAPAPCPAHRSRDSRRSTIGVPVRADRTQAPRTLHSPNGTGRSTAWRGVFGIPSDREQPRGRQFRRGNTQASSATGASGCGHTAPRDDPKRLIHCLGAARDYLAPPAGRGRTRGSFSRCRT
jgi:hypothetical protein